MQDFERIYFIKEYIIGYSNIVAMFLCSTSERFKIIPKSEVKSTYLLGMTFYSIESYSLLKKMREEFKQNEIIVGGIGVYSSYNRILSIADYVYFGEAYNFNEDCILSKKYEKNKIYLNNKVNFNDLPIVRVSKNSYNMQIEVGCPYHCEYCFVSAINDFQKIDNFNFKAKIEYLERKFTNKTITFIGNEGIVKEMNADLFLHCKKNTYNSRSITLKNYLKYYQLYKDQDIVHLGIELPTEELRVAHLPVIKHIKDAEIIEIITKKYMRQMQFYFIWNYINTTENDYGRIYDILRQKNDFLLRLDFTTLEIRPYTKLVPKISEHIEQLLHSISFADSIVINKLKYISKIKIIPAKSNKSVLRNYLFDYSMLDINTVVNDKVVETLQHNAEMMKRNANELSIVKF